MFDPNKFWQDLKTRSSNATKKVMPKNSSNKTVFWFLVGILVAGLIVDTYMSSVVTPQTMNLIRWLFVIITVFWIFRKFNKTGTSISMSSRWIIPVGITLFVLAALSQLNQRWWHDVNWFTLLLIAIGTVAVYEMNRLRIKGSTLVLAFVILLFITSGGLSLRGSNLSLGEKESAEVRKVKIAQASNRPRLIDTIVDLTGSNDFYFETGNYMNVYIRAISSGKGMYYEKNAIVYFTPPNGMPFKANTKGEALPVVVDSTAKDSDALNVIPGTYHVWGVHKVAIKTEWQKPEEQEIIASN